MHHFVENLSESEFVSIVGIYFDFAKWTIYWPFFKVKKFKILESSQITYHWKAYNPMKQRVKFVL